MSGWCGRVCGVWVCVIVRPGPYICAEWEIGGLPALVGGVGVCVEWVCVIVRPGPYICAEWEIGGLPA